MNKKTTILVTDSGLGGLSVFAGMAKTLAEDKTYDSIRMIYFNAWPEQYKGYNHFPDMADRAKVFHNAMSAMAKFRPDKIFIACNTLSVIYPFTQFAKETQIPVTGIIDHGVKMAAAALEADPLSQAIIFATPATIEGNSHKNALIKMGFKKERIITQPCLNLAGKIERDPFGREVKEMIHANAKAAAAQLKDKTGQVFALLCCTHFGYCKDLFDQALSLYTGTQVEILNPNDEMTAIACQNAIPGGNPNISMEIFSRVTWEESRLEAYDRLLSPICPQVATALKTYTLDRDLFSIEIE
ncbi:MAG: aspartate/glutamate racemase family protein [Desulfobacter sp.]|nr:aspartate/glutamate racemase family protein [Desulfobacter sp.]